MAWPDDAALNIKGTPGNPALNIGQTGDDDRSLSILARTAGARAQARIAIPARLLAAARTAGARANAPVAYDPNLLSAVHAVAAEDWRTAAPGNAGLFESWSRSILKVGGGPERWNEAIRFPASRIDRWQDSARVIGAGIDRFSAADLELNSASDSWRHAGRVALGASNFWRSATPLGRCDPAQWISTLPRLTPFWRQPWSQGTTLPKGWIDRNGDGARLVAVEIELWRQAGYPANAANPGPAIPTRIPAPWGTSLNIACPLPGAALKIGRVPCVLVAEREVIKRRTYMSINSASLARWPDLTPLPCTSITVETDFESWCWGLSATLAGPDAWSLVQPNPLACEVLATINGQQWTFLLDVPSSNRAFNSNKVTLKGRSRSAWLHAPYTPGRNLSESNPRDMDQLAEAALDNTGWTVDWQIPNWLVPAGRYVSQNTPIGALVRLVATTNDGLYTDPAAQIITAQPRWPLAAWLVDGATVDLLVPEDAVISLTQSPVYTLPLNGVYVSGITHGALALVKIAGTDGALQPDAPLTDELLCDPEGVAARQRGLNALSDSGLGFEMDAELLFTPEVGLIRPGLVVSIAGMKGVSRSVRVTANWSGNALKVRQSVGLERREVEA